MNNIYDYAEKVLKIIAIQGFLIVAKMKIDSKLVPGDIIFGNQDFLKVKRVSKLTIREWIETIYTGFSQLSNKNYYCLSDAKAVLIANYNFKK